MSEEHTAICMAFGLTPRQGKLLSLLLASPSITSEVIEAQLETDGAVAIFRLRKKLKPFNIEVRSCYDVGYALSSEMKDRARDLIAEYAS